MTKPQSPSVVLDLRTDAPAETKKPEPPWRLPQAAAPPPTKVQRKEAAVVVPPRAPPAAMGQPPAAASPVVWPTEENEASTAWFSSRLNPVAKHAFMLLYARNQRELVRERAYNSDCLRSGTPTSGNINSCVCSWAWLRMHS